MNTIVHSHLNPGASSGIAPQRFDAVGDFVFVDWAFDSDDFLDESCRLSGGQCVVPLEWEPGSWLRHKVQPVLRGNHRPAMAGLQLGQFPRPAVATLTLFFPLLAASSAAAILRSWSAGRWNQSVDQTRWMTQP